MLTEISVKVSFLKHTLTRTGPSIVEGDYNSTKLIFDIEENVSGKRIVFKLSNPAGEVIFLKDLDENNEVLLVGKDADGYTCSLFPSYGLYAFELVLYGGDSKLTSAPGWLTVSQRQVTVLDNTVSNYLPLLDKLSAINHSVFIKYSASPDGTGYTSEWAIGQRYIGIATGFIEPTDKLEYTWIEAIPDASTIHKEIECRLDNLEKVNLGHTYNFQTVKTVAEKQPVPDNSSEYAILSSVGGYTKKCTNLLALVPGYRGEGEQGEGSVERFTVAVDKDGYFTIDSAGVDTGISCVLELPEEMFKNIKDGATISTYVRYVSGSANGGMNGDNPYISLPVFYMRDVAMTPGATYTETTIFNKQYGFTMQVVGVFNQLKLAITVVEGNTAVDDHVYYEGLKSAKVKSVKSYGKNLVTNDMQDIQNWDIKTNSTYAIFALPEIASNGYYTLSAKKNPDLSWGGAVFKVEMSKDGGATWSYPDGMGDYFFTSAVDKSPLTFSLEKGHLVRFLLFPKTQSTIDKIMDVQFERGSKATEYAPYVGLIDTYDVPDAIQALDGYGANDTYIDFASKTFVNGETSTDISEHITDTVYLKVEGNGYIVAENDEGIEAYLTMTYQVKL